MYLSDSTKMKWADSYTIGTLGVPSRELMERAAHRLLDAALELLGKPEGKRVLVFCGSGNNGGDGFALARLLRARRAVVRAALVGSREKLTRDCAVMEERFETVGGFDANAECFLQKCDLVVDAMFGIGLNAPLRGAALEAARAINASGKPVLAVDMPSGVSADSGLVPGEAVRADVTVTFSMAKPGQLSEPGCALCGRLVVADIGIPAEVLQRAECGVEATGERETDALIPKRSQFGHKGSFGKTLLVCGSTGFTGAAFLSSEMAVRSGAGLVKLACSEEIYPILASGSREAMPFPSERSIDALRPELKRADAVLMGCGLGRGEAQDRLAEALLKECSVPLVLDADGINALEGRIDLLREAGCPVVLTPHEGEFLRAGGDLGLGRLKAASEFAKNYNVYLVLKGHRTIVAAPDGREAVNLSGNSGLAKGGSGDVLAGLLVGLLAQGLTPYDACRAAVWLHGAAGDLCAEELGEYGMTPTDVISAVTRKMKKYS